MPLKACTYVWEKGDDDFASCLAELNAIQFVRVASVELIQEELII